MAKKTYKLSNWHTDSGKNPIGVEYRNTWLRATIKGDDLTDCNIEKVNVHFPKLRCTFNPAGELRLKYGGVTLTRKVGSTSGSVEEKTYNFTGAKDTMFKKGNGEVVFYAYHPYDEGYFAIDDAGVTIEVEYTPKTSRLELTDKTVAAGSELAFTVKSYGETYTHKATLTMGDKSASVDLAAGVNEGSIPVALDWLEIIPSATFYDQGTLKLETYKGDTLMGEDTVKNVQLKLPSNRLLYAPTFGEITTENMFTVDGVTYPDLGVGLVQGKSGLRVSVTGCKGKYGASVTTKLCVLDKEAEGGEDVSLETGLLYTSSVTFRMSLIDSRGIETVSYPRTLIIVHPYTPPFASINAWRVDALGDKDDFGTRGQYECEYGYTSLNGANEATVTLNVANVAVNDPPESGTLEPTLDINHAYDVVLTVTDAYEMVTAKSRIPGGKYLLHGNAKGNGAGIGTAATVENALVINPDWAVWAGDKNIITLLNTLVQDVDNLKQSGGGGSTTPSVPSDVQEQLTTLQTQVEAMKPKVLWEGEWSSGEIAIPGIGDYSVVQVDMTVGNALATVSEGTVQGGGFNVTNALHRTVVFRATRNGELCMLATAHYINHEAGGAHGSMNAQTVTRVVGLVRST